jgi:hypothetical protein
VHATKLGCLGSALSSYPDWKERILGLFTQKFEKFDGLGASSSASRKQLTTAEIPILGSFDTICKHVAMLFSIKQK